MTIAIDHAALRLDWIAFCEMVFNFEARGHSIILVTSAREDIPEQDPLYDPRYLTSRVYQCCLEICPHDDPQRFCAESGIKYDVWIGPVYSEFLKKEVKEAKKSGPRPGWKHTDESRKKMKQAALMRWEMKRRFCAKEEGRAPTDLDSSV